MLSVQTNVNSLIAQENLRVTSMFQSRTIQRLTSGYRINSASDDAAGLAVANKFRTDVAELTQGVRNATDGVGQLQIIDGGLNNVSKILDRLKTLATQSASDTFSGNRATLNSEYNGLLHEIDRQASNIGLVNQGAFNKNLAVYVGGGSSQTNAQVSIDLSGTTNQVDSAGLSIGTTSVNAGGTTLTGNSVTDLNDASKLVLTAAGASSQTFNVNYVDSSNARQTLAVSVTSGAAAGITVADALSQMNAKLSTIGLQASVTSAGALAIGGTRQFALTGTTEVGSPTNLIATANSLNVNQADYRTNEQTWVAPTVTPEILSFSNGSVTKYVTLAVGSASMNANIDTINTAVGSMGIQAVQSAAGKFTIMSSGSFSLNLIQAGTAGTFGTSLGAVTVNTPNTSATSVGNSLAALTAIENAVGTLGQVQGRVGSGQNQLQYAINLAQSQISNFSSAEAMIRDTDVAAEAANLTKAQVLQQASMAAMAQANSAPQAVLALLRG
jgi:flagellin